MINFARFDCLGDDHGTTVCSSTLSLSLKKFCGKIRRLTRKFTYGADNLLCNHVCFKVAEIRINNN
jgi:hypothetical protein